MSRAGPWPARGLAGDTLLSLIAIAVVGGSSAAFSLAVGRWLGEAPLGLAGMALALGMGAAQVAVSGIGPATTRFTAAALAAGRPRRARAALITGLTAALLLGGLLAAFAGLSSDRWSARLGLSSGLAAAAAWLVLAQSAYLGLKAALYGLGLVREYAAAELIGGVAFAAALAAVVLGGGGQTLLPFLAANLAFCVVGATVLAARLPRAGPSPSAAVAPLPAAQATTWRVPGMAAFATVATVGSSAALARLSLGPLVTGLLWPADEVGLLQAALSFLLLVLFVPRGLELALFPALSAAHGRHDGAALRRQAERALSASALVLGLVAGAVMLAGRSLLTALYGPSFAAAAPALAWVAVSGWALGLAVPAVSALSGADAVRVPNAAAVLGLAASLLAWVRLVPALGAEGAAIGLAAGSLVNAAIPLLGARRLLGIGLRPAARTLGASGAALAVAATLRGWTGMPDLAAALFYCALLALVERRRLTELLGRAADRVTP